MNETPQITQVEAQPAAVIPITIPRAQIAEVMGPGITELMSVLAAQGITPTGPWFSHHLKVYPDIFDFEIGVPVPGAVADSGRVRPGRLPAATVARTVYQGGYEGLGEAWGEFDAWLSANGHATAPDFWEVYAVGPETSEDPADWRTELIRPLA